MTALFYQPYLTRKEGLFDELFYDFFNSGNSGLTIDNKRHEINETDDTITLTVDVPGFDKSDIQIDYNDNQLLIQAKSDNESRKAIKQQYTIPNMDIKKSSADLKNGVLTLHLEKVATAKKQQLKIT